jgi:predicted nucleic acid-binding protein
VTIVSDTSPLSAWAEIGALALLAQLFGSIIIPAAVLAECRHSGAPLALQRWVASPPAWVTVAGDTSVFPDCARNLDPGEAAALALAAALPAPVLLLMDERKGVAAARSLGLPFTGTLGLLIRGHRLGLLDFEPALTRLRQTSFHLSPSLIARARSLLA